MKWLPYSNNARFISFDIIDFLGGYTAIAKTDIRTERVQFKKVTSHSVPLYILLAIAFENGLHFFNLSLMRCH